MRVPNDKDSWGPTYLGLAMAGAVEEEKIWVERRDWLIYWLLGPVSHVDIFHR